MSGLDPARDYPLGSKRPELVATPDGTPLSELTLDRLRAGLLGGEDVRATAETLGMQADIADAVGRPELGENLRRAAELTRVPNDAVMAIYTALRPGRSSSDGLESWAVMLEDEYDAPRLAAFVREANDAYRERGLLT